MRKTIVGLVLLCVFVFAGHSNIQESDRQWVNFGPSGDRLAHATVYDSDNDMIYMAGGTPNGTPNNFVPQCDAYDPRANSWYSLGSMPDARGWIQGAYMINNLIIVGGVSNSGSPLSTILGYDIPGGSWSYLGSIPEARYGHGTVVWNNNIYVIGGIGTQTVYCSSGGWSQATPLPYPFEYGGVCIWDNVIYIAGGYDRVAGQAWTHIWSGTINPSDPPDITWTELDTLPAPMFANAATALDGNVYILGGFHRGTVSDEFWRYEHTGGTWMQLADYPVTVARDHYLVARIGHNEVYAVAGDANGNWGPPNNYCYYYEYVNVSESSFKTANDHKLTLNPSISTKETTISFSLDVPNEVSVALHNTAGQRVGTVLSNQRMRSGEHHINCPLRDLAAGIYFIRLQIGEESFVKKFVVTK